MRVTKIVLISAFARATCQWLFPVKLIHASGHAGLVVADFFHKFL
jgi:hypothetical protein